MAKLIQTVPFNFDELYTGLSTKFNDAGYDVNPGSNTSQLVTAMAYLTSMLNINTAANINETILPLSTKRDTVLENARAIGYEIQHKQSFVYRLSIVLDGSPTNTYTIPKYAMFEENGKKYYYMGSQLEYSNVTTPKTISIAVKEGVLYQHNTHPDTLIIETGTVKDGSGIYIPQYFIDIPFNDIEQSGIECYITYYDEFGTLISDEEWLKADKYVDENLVKKRFYRMDDISYLTPRIYFELGGVGTGLRVGSTVKLHVLKTSSVDGGMSIDVLPEMITHSIANGVIESVALISEGAAEESLESIKENAPKIFNSAYRAVTANDYRSITNRQASVDDSYVWGGNEELPKSPGHIWFSFLPSVLPRTFTSDIHKKAYLRPFIIYNIGLNWLIVCQNGDNIFIE